MIKINGVPESVVVPAGEKAILEKRGFVVKVTCGDTETFVTPVGFDNADGKRDAYFYHNTTGADVELRLEAPVADAREKAADKSYESGKKMTLYKKTISEKFSISEIPVVGYKKNGPIKKVVSAKYMVVDPKRIEVVEEKTLTGCYSYIHFDFFDERYNGCTVFTTVETLYAPVESDNGLLAEENVLYVTDDLDRSMVVAREPPSTDALSQLESLAKIMGAILSSEE